MALFGMVFALGGVEAAAQPALDTVVWTPESATVEIDASEGVWTQGGQAIAEAFTVTWTGKTGGPAEGVSHTISASVGDAEDDFTVTFDTAIPTYAAGVAVTYTAPSPADPTKDILDTETSGYTPVATGAISTVTERDVRPMISDIDNMTFEKGKEIEAFQLPDATGNAGTGFTYIVSDLPDGLLFDDNGIDDASSTAAEREDDRMVSGTPTMVTDGDQIVTYTVRDGSTPPDSSSVRFTITVTDKPARPEAPVVTPTMNTSGSLDVMWTEPAPNNSAIFDYEVQHREVDTERWMMHTADLGTRTSATFSGLTDGTEYEFQVRARNDVDWSEWSMSGKNTPMASTAAPAAPDRPTVVAGGRGELVVSWTAPATNGSTITGYDVQYWIEGQDRRQRDDVPGITTTLDRLGDSMEYNVRVRANSNNGDSPWSEARAGTTAAAPAAPSTTLADITEIDVSAAEERRIGGVERRHLHELNDRDSTVTVKVEWTVAQLREIYAGSATPGPVHVALVAVPVNDSASWLSPAEVGNQLGQDLPDNFEWVSINIPKKPAASARDRDTVPAMGTMSLTLLQDDDAEDEAFRLTVGRGSQGVSLEARRSELETDIIVIDDDETQKIVVERSSSGTVYEGDDVEFEVSAKPELVNLQIDVRFDLTDEKGAAVSSRVVGLSPASDSIGAGDDEIKVTIELEENDGNRDNDVLMFDAVVVSRNRDDIEIEYPKDSDHAVTVVDVHRLPPLTVMPGSADLMEGKKLELTLTVDRNPKETRAIDPEMSQYTTEALSIAVTPSGAAASNYALSATTIAVDEYKHKAGQDWMQTVSVTVEALPDEDVEADSMLMLDFVVNGTKAENGPSDTMADAQATLTLQDATETLVSVGDNAYEVIQGVLGTPPTLMTGASSELMGANLFDYDAAAVSIAYATSVEGGAVTASTSGGTVTIMAVSAGEAKVTITATATPNASSLV
ncbi:MAG: fibronectin type III domain-containing protein, partial [Gammaproteobacteria bacterium]|nr:fibronectin type III domain-containing protein [Gammaproteobacteria bacterium]